MAVAKQIKNQFWQDVMAFISQKMTAVELVLCVCAAILSLTVFVICTRCTNRKPEGCNGSSSDTQSVAILALRAIDPDAVSNALTNGAPDTPDAVDSSIDTSAALTVSTAETDDIDGVIKTKVPLCHFRRYVRQKMITGRLLKQFHRFPISAVYACFDGDRPQCDKKNRYGNILPYDYNRVVLDSESNTISSSYINASFVKGYAHGSFIATQGPFTEVIGDFWTMIWQKNVSKIVMLTNLVENNREKCEQYWPNLGQADMITPDLVVECLEENTDGEFTIRDFILTKEGNESRRIRQFHFTTWPDCYVPDNVTSLLKLRKAVTTPTDVIICPVVVHCSAGVGRTGTYIALDYLINQAEAEGVVDVFDCVLGLRHQRMNMVQTEEQYLLIHDVLQRAIDDLKDEGFFTVPSVSIDLEIRESTV